jgi:hypothetical protein
VGSIALVIALPKIAPAFVRRYGDRVIEPEIKLVFVCLFVLMVLADASNGHPVLPAFILGLAIRRHTQTAEAAGCPEWSRCSLRVGALSPQRQLTAAADESEVFAATRSGTARHPRSSKGALSTVALAARPAAGVSRSARWRPPLATRERDAVLLAGSHGSGHSGALLVASRAYGQPLR